MAETATFSSSGEDAITRTIDLDEDISGPLQQNELEVTYDIVRTAEAIERGDYQRVRTSLFCDANNH